VKLLFDQNLSHKLARRLTDIFPDSTHVREVGLKEANDPVVWDYAKQQSFMIVSKDADFHQRSFAFGFPPKVVWVQLGNCTTAEVEQVIR
jgi:predicted nuclease of predicted toxin-antitoxin system